ncbi:MAG TPA: HAMP domain-containing sensor histidine kinase [Planctomycetota bacterium]|jgi:signal transduction histidine kinase
MDELESGLLPVERELSERVSWFVRLRWAAGLSVLATAIVLRYGLQWPLSFYAEVIGLCVLLYNVPFWLLLRKYPALARRAASHLANLQINIDLIALTALLHFTGGCFSPLLPFAVFHIMIASLLLRRRDVFLQAALAIVLFGALCWAEWHQWLAAENLGALPIAAQLKPAGIVLVFLGFAALLVITASLASTLGHHLRRLEDKDAKAHIELEHAHRKLEDADRAKSKFTLMVTHELRSPLSAVQSLLEVLRQGYSGEMPPSIREMIGRIADRVDILLELVNQLLDLARDKVDLAPQRQQDVRIDYLFRQMEEAYRAQAEAKGLKLVIGPLDEELAVRGNADELVKVCSNLVSNAVKYTPAGGQASMRASRDGANVVLEFSDTGIGIPKSEQERLFTEFFRATNAKLVAVHGTGLGLAIVKRVVEAHGGTLRFSSEEGRGTSFWISLPLSTAISATGTPHEHAAAQLSEPRP